jgi:hypothetical protein
MRMGGDFDKGGPGLGLGLRKAIKKAAAKKQVEDKAAKKQAEEELNLLVQKLFNQMKIIEKVSLAVFKGQSSVMIPFPNEWRKISVDTRLSGKITHSLVVENMVEKIKEENLGVSVIRNRSVGCCNKSRQIKGRGEDSALWHCRHCDGVWELDTSWEKEAFLREGKDPCCIHIKARKCYGNGRAVMWESGFQVHRGELYSGSTLKSGDCVTCGKRFKEGFAFDKLKLSKLNS